MIFDNKINFYLFRHVKRFSLIKLNFYKKNVFFRCRDSNLGSLDTHATQLRYHCATFALSRARVFSVHIISPKKQKSGHDLNSIGIVGNRRQKKVKINQSLTKVEGTYVPQCLNWLNALFFSRSILKKRFKNS